MFSSAFAQEAAKGTPAVAGAIATGVTQNWLIGVFTVLYIVIQAAYLLRKWWREEKDWRRERKLKGLETEPASLGD